MIIFKIISLFTLFNNYTNFLIKQLTQYNNLEEDSIVFFENLIKQFKTFKTFTQKTVLRVIFRTFDKASDMKYNFDENILDTNMMINKIFHQLTQSLNNLLSNKSSNNKQEEINNILRYLGFLQKLIGTLMNMTLSLLKFQSNVIKEDEFTNKYKIFKVKMEEYKKEFEQLYVKN